MDGKTDEMRKILGSEPHASIEPWNNGFDLAGEGYLEELNIERLVKAKDALDVVLQTGSCESLRSHYKDEIYP